VVVAHLLKSLKVELVGSDVGLTHIETVSHARHEARVRKRNLLILGWVAVDHAASISPVGGCLDEIVGEGTSRNTLMGEVVSYQSSASRGAGTTIEVVSIGRVTDAHPVDHYSGGISALGNALTA
jgi:hypothetical protein